MKNQELVQFSKLLNNLEKLSVLKLSGQGKKSAFQQQKRKLQ